MHSSPLHRLPIIGICVTVIRSRKHEVLHILHDMPTDLKEHIEGSSKTQPAKKHRGLYAS